jgi:hypothetical protein
VTWYHELTGNWATWEPGDQVEPGTIGFFDRDQVFTSHYRKLAAYGIVPGIVTAELPGRSRLVWSEGDVHLDFKASGQSSAGFEALGSLDAGLKAMANREHACVLHMHDLSEAWIENVEAVLLQIKGLLLSGQWEVDLVVVARRLEARRGFAAVSLGSGRSFEAKADGHARIAGAADLGSAGFRLAPGAGAGITRSGPSGPALHRSSHRPSASSVTCGTGSCPGAVTAAPWSDPMAGRIASCRGIRAVMSWRHGGISRESRLRPRRSWRQWP